MNRLIYSYALLKALIDESQDYIDAFWPFVIRKIPQENRVQINIIQKELNNSYKLRIPIHVLKTILDRAKIKEYIKITKAGDIEEYSLTKKGINYINSQVTPQEVKREINSLVMSIKEFYKDNGIEAEECEIGDILEKFIGKNLEPLVGFFRESDDPDNFNVLDKNPEDSTIKRNEYTEEKLDDKELLLIKYINEINLKKHNEYNTLKNLVLGSLIYSIINSEKYFKFLELGSYKSEKCKINECRIYFDTNYIFPLLNLDYHNFNKSSQELFELLKKFECKTYVFSFTVDEICRVVKGYQTVCEKYPSKIMPGTIYSSLKTKGWNKTDSALFIANVRQKLEKIGILIDEVENINLSNYQPEDPKIRTFFYENERVKERTNFSQNHDLAAIENIKKIRGKDVRKIEEAEAIFVTSDNSLNEINFIKMGHKDKGTIPEVILDRVLTNILWIKNPKIDVSLELIVAAHSKELFVQKNVWDKFYDTILKVRKMEEGQEIKDEEILSLIVERALNEPTNDFSENEVDRIIKGLIQHADLDIINQIETIEDNRKKQEYDEKLETIINSIKKDNEHALEEKYAEIEKKFETELLVIKEQHATEKADLSVTYSKVVFFVVFAAIIFIFWSQLVNISKIIPFFMFIFAILGIKFDRLWDQISNVFRKRYM